MKHEETRELLALRLYGELDSNEERGLEAHLADCGACRTFARELEATLAPHQRSAAASRPEALPADWEERMRRATAEPRAPLGSPRGGSARPSARALATFAAGIAAGLLLALSPRLAQEDDRNPPRVEVLSNAKASPRPFGRPAPPPPTTSRSPLAAMASWSRR